MLLHCTILAYGSDIKIMVHSLINAYFREVQSIDQTAAISTLYTVYGKQWIIVFLLYFIVLYCIVLYRIEAHAGTDMNSLKRQLC